MVWVYCWLRLFFVRKTIGGKSNNYEGRTNFEEG